MEPKTTGKVTHSQYEKNYRADMSLHPTTNWVLKLTIRENTSHHTRLDDIDITFDQSQNRNEQFDGIAKPLILASS